MRQAATFDLTYDAQCGSCHGMMEPGEKVRGSKEPDGWHLAHIECQPVASIPDTLRFQRLLQIALGRTYDAAVILDSPPFALKWSDV